MRSIWKYLTGYVRQDFNGLQYGLIFLFLAFTIFFNYLVDFEDSILDVQKGFWKFFSRLIFFSVAYYTTSFITCTIKKETTSLTQGWFWIKSMLALCLLKPGYYSSFSSGMD
jgi:hypothetical protein